jgi:exonuclease VII large subunit
MNVMKRGFSITQKEHHTIKSSNQAEEGDTIKTYLYEGTIISQVSHKNDRNEKKTS